MANDFQDNIDELDDWFTNEFKQDDIVDSLADDGFTTPVIRKIKIHQRNKCIIFLLLSSVCAFILYLILPSLINFLNLQELLSTFSVAGNELTLLETNPLKSIRFSSEMLLAVTSSFALFVAIWFMEDLELL